MQEGINASPTWIQIALGALASFIAGGAGYKYLNTWLNRKKPAAEITVTEATAAEITVRAGSTAGDAIMRFMSRLEQAQASIDRLRIERDSWEEQYDAVFTERARLARENSKLQSEVDAYEKQMKRMQRTMAENNINYDNTQDDVIGPLPDIE